MWSKVLMQQKQLLPSGDRLAWPPPNVSETVKLERLAECGKATEEEDRDGGCCCWGWEEDAPGVGRFWAEEAAAVLLLEKGAITGWEDEEEAGSGRPALLAKGESCGETVEEMESRAPRGFLLVSGTGGCSPGRFSTLARCAAPLFGPVDEVSIFLALKKWQGRKNATILITSCSCEKLRSDKKKSIHNNENRHSYRGMILSSVTFKLKISFINIFQYKNSKMSILTISWLIDCLISTIDKNQ